MKSDIAYWDRPGRKNTAKTIAAAVQRARALGIGRFIVASCSGYTVKQLLKFVPGSAIVMITHQAGFRKPGMCEMPARAARALTGKGVTIYTGTHFFGGVGRAVRVKFGGLEVDELVAHTLRIFGQGVKVAVEITVMALDAGLIPHGREIIAIGGTGEGADTAVVCMPAHGKDLFSFEIREIICMPRQKK